MISYQEITYPIWVNKYDDNTFFCNSLFISLLWGAFMN